jgi:hypothetical protein
MSHVEAPAVRRSRSLIFAVAAALAAGSSGVTP